MYIEKNSSPPNQSSLAEASLDMDGGSRSNLSNGGEVDNPIAAEYDQQLERARVRESIRSFVREVRETWCALPAGLNKNNGFSSLDHVMKYKNLTSFRTRWFFYFLTSKLIASAVFVSVAQFFIAFGATSTSSTAFFKSITLTHLLIASVFAALAWPILRRLQNAHRDKLERNLEQYRSALSTHTTRIENNITEYINAEVGKHTNSHAKMKDFTSTEQGANIVREGIVETMFSWRKLERMAHYIRHEWDMYAQGVQDERFLTSNSSPRVLHVVLSTLLIASASILSLIAVVIAMSSNQSGSAILSSNFITASIALFAVSYAFATAITKQGVLTLARRLLFLVAAAFSIILTTWSGDADPQKIALMHDLYVSFGLYVSITNILAWNYARRTGHDYKEIADAACVKIVLALKTHQKGAILRNMQMKIQDFLKYCECAESKPTTWGGWTPTYEAEQREKLRSAGDRDEAEIDIQIAADPIIYVGEENNRRIQVCNHDPTIILVRKFPHVRTV